MSRHNRRCNSVKPPHSHATQPCHHGVCSCGKVRFPDHAAAVAALHDAATQRHFAAQDGTTTRRREIRSYSCKECKGWHLTSKPHQRNEFNVDHS